MWGVKGVRPHRDLSAIPKIKLDKPLDQQMKGEANRYFICTLQKTHYKKHTTKNKTHRRQFCCSGCFIERDKSDRIGLFIENISLYNPD
jgi:hypothetical protein